MLKHHRDYKRQNKANLAVQGSLYAKMNKASISNIRDRINVSTNTQICPDTKAELLKMCEIACLSNVLAYDHFIQAQSEVSTKTCRSYANEQYSSLVRCCQFQENINLVPSISKSIITDKMVQIVNNIVGNFDQSGKI